MFSNLADRTDIICWSPNKPGNPPLHYIDSNDPQITVCELASLLDQQVLRIEEEKNETCVKKMVKAINP